MFPNPVKANHNVKMGFASNEVEIGTSSMEIFNTMGMRISAKTCNGSLNEMTAPSAAGIYIIKITLNDGKLYYGKLIVE